MRRRRAEITAWLAVAGLAGLASWGWLLHVASTVASEWLSWPHAATACGGSVGFFVLQLGLRSCGAWRPPSLGSVSGRSALAERAVSSRQRWLSAIVLLGLVTAGALSGDATAAASCLLAAAGLAAWWRARGLAAAPAVELTGGAPRSLELPPVEVADWHPVSAALLSWFPAFALSAAASTWIRVGELSAPSARPAIAFAAVWALLLVGLAWAAVMAWAAYRSGRASRWRGPLVGRHSLVLERVGRSDRGPLRIPLSALAGLRVGWREGRAWIALADGRRLPLPLDPLGRVPVDDLRVRWELFGRELAERHVEPASPAGTSVGDWPTGAGFEHPALFRLRRVGWVALLVGTACLVPLAAWLARPAGPSTCAAWATGALVAAFGWSAWSGVIALAAARAAGRALESGITRSHSRMRDEVETGLRRARAVPTVLLFAVPLLLLTARPVALALASLLVAASALLAGGLALGRVWRVLELAGTRGEVAARWDTRGLQPRWRLPLNAWEQAFLLPSLAGLWVWVTTDHGFWLAGLPMLLGGPLLLLAALGSLAAACEAVALAFRSPTLGPRSGRLALWAPAGCWGLRWSVRRWSLEELAEARFFRESDGWHAHLGERGDVLLPPHFTELVTVPQVRAELRRLRAGDAAAEAR